MSSAIDIHIASYARRHAIKRAWQRFGAAMSFQDVCKVEQRIWAGRASWVADLHGPRQAYSVKLNRRIAVAVFDIHLECIVTFMFPGMKLYGRAI